MSAVLRPLFLYLFLLIVFRLSGRRSLAEISTFDFVLLLIIGEATQQALLGEDCSITNAIIVILTLATVDVLLSLLKARSPGTDRWTEGRPLVLVEDGQMLEALMRKARIDENDILQAARETQGLASIAEIKYAVLERSGGIAVIPRRE